MSEKYLELVKVVLHNANKSEIDAMNAYFESGMDKHCYQDHFYKVWADERIKELEEQLEKAKEVITRIATDNSPPWDNMDHQALCRTYLKKIEERKI